MNAMLQPQPRNGVQAQWKPIARPRIWDNGGGGEMVSTAWSPCTTSADIIIINKCNSSASGSHERSAPGRRGCTGGWHWGQDSLVLWTERRTTIYGMFMSWLGLLRESAKLELICGTQATTKALLLTWPRNGRRIGSRMGGKPCGLNWASLGCPSGCVCSHRQRHFKIYDTKLILLPNKNIGFSLAGLH